MRLALAMGKTLGELNGWLDRHPGEWPLWVAYNRVEPIPEPWLQTGLTCSTIANAAGAKMGATDFMPVTQKARPGRQSAAEVKQTMARWVKAIERRDREAKD
jgi:hypothetical protein